MHGVLVSRPDVADRTTHRRRNLAPPTQQSDDEEPKPVRVLAHPRRLGLGLVLVRNDDPARSIPPAPAPEITEAEWRGNDPGVGATRLDEAIRLPPARRGATVSLAA